MSIEMIRMSTQRSEWSSERDATVQHGNSSFISNRNIVINHLDNDVSNQSKLKSSCKCQLRKYCPITFPCCQGMILGMLIAGLIFAVLITLWLKSKHVTSTTSNVAAEVLNTASVTTQTTSTSSTATTSTVSTSTTTSSTSTTSTTTSITTVTTTSVTTSTTSTTTTTSITTVTTTSVTTSTTSTTTSTISTSTLTSTSTTTSITTVTTTSVTTSTTSTTTSTKTTSTSTSATTSTTSSATTSTTPGSTTTPSCSSPSSVGRIFTISASSATTNYTLYSYNFTANRSLFTLTFPMKGDSGPAHRYWLLDSVSVNHTNTSTDVLINGDFETGDFTGWIQYCATDANCGGTGYYGQLTNNTCYSGSYCYMDRCSGGYDYLTQSFTTVIGDYYVVSFYLKIYAAPGPYTIYVMLT